MSEVPEGVNLPVFARKTPRPTVTLTLTRDGENGVEVLLGRRSETMRAFPGYWAFPGGGVSRSDIEVTRFISNNSGAQDSAIVAVVTIPSDRSFAVKGFVAGANPIYAMLNPIIIF